MEKAILSIFSLPKSSEEQQTIMTNVDVFCKFMSLSHLLSLVLSIYADMSLEQGSSVSLTRRWSSRSSSSTFYIFAIQSIPCSLIKTTGAEEVAVGAKNQFMVLATIVQNADLMKRDGTSTGIINHVRNCRLGCTIPCTQSILSFSLMKRHIILNKKKNTNKRPNANSAMNLADNTLIVVIAATSTFTPHVLPYCPPSNLLNYCVHNTCASLPLRLKVLVHRHPLHLIHSSLEVELHQSDSRFCQLCAQKVNTNFGFYYCSRCDFIAHLDCAADYGNRDNMNLLELKELENEDSELDQSVDSAAYKVKNIKVREDGTKIATKIQHFSHKHELKLSDNEVLNNEKCNGCVQAILSTFYSCVNCRFFLHESCAKLPRKKRHPLHRHLLTLLPEHPYFSSFFCDACERDCNSFIYRCETCYFNLDVSCNLISDILTHPGHEHQLLLSSIKSKLNCNCCDSKISPIFRCTTCEFALDFKCATLPQIARYKQHEHLFTLYYTAEDDSGEYYCDIFEEERNSKHWFYYCADCSYPAHTKCILGKNPNLK
ncbi:uncharacterized protein LOC115980222 [Quercus lobata]|uniref:uncharacterized protein LOC115980222 n=1 Tax=Quercus lobata TaxID=97700 RepID=UPI001246ED4A|nr:uncharacterized protein LOC115980222 [Quercus lobata]